VVIGPGNGAVGAPAVLLDRAKMELNVWVVKEPRRARPEDSADSEELFSLLDILKEKAEGTEVGRRLQMGVEVMSVVIV